MAKQLERVQVSAHRGYIPATACNPLTGLDMPMPRGMADRLADGDQVIVLERDFTRSATLFLRSFDGGRTWTAFQAHEILRTR